MAFRDISPELLVNIYTYAGLFDSNDCNPPLEHIIMLDNVFKKRAYVKQTHALMRYIDMASGKYSVLTSWLNREYLGSFFLFAYNYPLRAIYLHSIGLIPDSSYDTFIKAYMLSGGRSTIKFYKLMHTFMDRSVYVNDISSPIKHTFDSVHETAYAFLVGLIDDEDNLINVIRECRYASEIIESLYLNETMVAGITYNNHPSNGISDTTYRAPRSCRVSRIYDPFRITQLETIILSNIPDELLIDVSNGCNTEHCEELLEQYDNDKLRLHIIQRLYADKDYKLPKSTQRIVIDNSYKHHVYEMILIRSGVYPEIISENMAENFYDYTCESDGRYMTSQWERLIMATGDKIIKYLYNYISRSDNQSIIDNTVERRCKMTYDMERKYIERMREEKEDEIMTTNNISVTNNISTTNNILTTSSAAPIPRLPGSANDLINFVLEHPGTSYTDEEKMIIISQIEDQDMLDMVIQIIYQ